MKADSIPTGDGGGGEFVNERADAAMKAVAEIIKKDYPDVAVFALASSFGEVATIGIGEGLRLRAVSMISNIERSQLPRILTSVAQHFTARRDAPPSPPVLPHGEGWEDDQEKDAILTSVDLSEALNTAEESGGRMNVVDALLPYAMFGASLFARFLAVAIDDSGETDEGDTYFKLPMESGDETIVYAAFDAGLIKPAPVPASEDGAIAAVEGGVRIQEHMLPLLARMLHARMTRAAAGDGPLPNDMTEIRPMIRMMSALMASDLMAQVEQGGSIESVKERLTGILPRGTPLDDWLKASLASFLAGERIALEEDRPPEWP